MTHFRRVNLAPLHPHPSCLPPGQVFKVGGEGRMQGYGSEFHRVHSLYRSRTSRLLEQGLPGLSTILWQRLGVSQREAAVLGSRSHPCEARVGLSLRLSRQKRTGTWRLSLLRGKCLRSAAGFAQLPPSPEPLASPFPGKIPPLQRQQLTELEKEQEQRAPPSRRWQSLRAPRCPQQRPQLWMRLISY